MLDASHRCPTPLPPPSFPSFACAVRSCLICASVKPAPLDPPPALRWPQIISQQQPTQSVGPRDCSHQLLPPDRPLPPIILQRRHDANNGAGRGVRVAGGPAAEWEGRGRRERGAGGRCGAAGPDRARAWGCVWAWGRRGGRKGPSLMRTYMHTHLSLSTHTHTYTPPRAVTAMYMKCFSRPTSYPGGPRSERQQRRAAWAKREATLEPGWCFAHAEVRGVGGVGKGGLFWGM
jgi:hypothetical protein